MSPCPCLGRRLSYPSRQTAFLPLPSRLHPEPELLALLVCPEVPPLAVPAILRRHTAILRALEPHHLTPHPYSTAPTSIGPLPGRNRSRRRRPPETRPPELRPLVNVPFPPLLNSIQGSGGLPHTLIHVPDLFFLRFTRYPRRERASPPCTAACRRPLVAPHSGPSSCATSARTEAT